MGRRRYPGTGAGSTTRSSARRAAATPEVAQPRQFARHDRPSPVAMLRSVTWPARSMEVRNLRRRRANCRGCATSGVAAARRADERVVEPAPVPGYLLRPMNHPRLATGQAPTGITDVHIHVQPWRELKPHVLETMWRGENAHRDLMIQVMDDPRALLEIMDGTGVWRAG